KRVATSPDGQRWTILPTGLRADFYRLASGGGEFLGLVDRFRLTGCCDELQGAVGFSANGLSWTGTWLNGSGKYSTLSFANDQFVAFEEGAPGTVPRVIVSANGREWSTARLWFGGGSAQGLAYGNGL